MPETIIAGKLRLKKKLQFAMWSTTRRLLFADLMRLELNLLSRNLIRMNCQSETVGTLHASNESCKKNMLQCGGIRIL